MSEILNRIQSLQNSKLSELETTLENTLIALQGLEQLIKHLADTSQNNLPNAIVETRQELMTWLESVSNQDKQLITDRLNQYYQLLESHIDQLTNQYQQNIKTIANQNISFCKEVAEILESHRKQNIKNIAQFLNSSLYLLPLMIGLFLLVVTLAMASLIALTGYWAILIIIVVIATAIMTSIYIHHKLHQQPEQ